MTPFPRKSNRFGPMIGVALLLTGCMGYPAPGGMAYMGSGGFNGLGPMGYGMGTGMMGAGSIGTQYGTGGMEMGTNLGGWGDGLGDNWGHPTTPQGAGTLDNDPHQSSRYQNPDFQNSSDSHYYHPGMSNP